MLAKLYSKEKPNNRTEMMLDSSDILTTLFCSNGDTDCHADMLQVSRKQFHDANDNVLPGDIYYPNNFDSKLMEFMNEMEYIVNGVTLDNVDDVLEQLNTIQSDIESLDVNAALNIRADHKVLALSGLSVAKESVALWNKVYSDPSHPLHGVHDPSYYFDKTKHGHGRKLQNLDLVAIIMADIRAALNSGTDIVLDDIAGTILSAAVNSIPASLLFALGDGEGGSDYYNGDGDNYYGGDCFLNIFCFGYS